MRLPDTYISPAETELYYLQSRYYNPEIGRFINVDSLVSTGQGVIGYNMFAYCNNNPINNYDPNGDIAISTIIGIIIGVGAIAATANDAYQIASGDVYVDTRKTNAENVHIENSYKIISPWMRYGYSFYLNHFNADTKDVIQGSTAGTQFEWDLHNYAAWLGVGGDSAKHLDVGKTIFSDGKYHPLRDENGNISPTGVMSLGMRGGHILC